MEGKALMHEVGAWNGGDRACVARWVWKSVLDALRIPAIPWATVDDVGKRLSL